MNVWFARCNGETAHNNPATGLYVPGEPPTYPDRKFEYKHECIVGGFARIGWPASGDLRASNWREAALTAYPDILDEHLTYLDQFASIQVGDVMLIPAYRDRVQAYVLALSPHRHRSEPGRSTNAIPTITTTTLGVARGLRMPTACPCNGHPSSPRCPVWDACGSRRSGRSCKGRLRPSRPLVTGDCWTTNEREVR